MSKEILMVVDAVSNEKDVDRDIIFGAIEAALATATRKKNRGDIDVRVDIDRHDGSYRTYRRWEVMGDTDEEGNPLNGLEFPSRQVTLDAARAMEPERDIQVGDYLEEEIESVEFGRIAARRLALPLRLRQGLVQGHVPATEHGQRVAGQVRPAQLLQLGQHFAYSFVLIRDLLPEIRAPPGLLQFPGGALPA